MPSKRDVLESLSLSDLVALADGLGVEVASRRSKGAMVDALAASRKAKLDVMLPGLPVASLKTACDKLGLSSSGRAKAPLVERLVGPRTDSAAKVTTRPAPAPKTATRAPVSASQTKAGSARAGAAAAGSAASEAARGAPSPAANPTTTRTVGRKASPAASASPTTEEPEVEAQPKPEVEAVAKPGAKKGRKGAAAQKQAEATPPAADEPAPKPDAETKGPASPAPPPKLQRSWFANDPTPIPATPPQQTVSCQHCRKKVPLRQCQILRCENWIAERAGKQVCAECLFERGQLTLTEFTETLRAESACPHCGKPWDKRKTA